MRNGIRGPFPRGRISSFQLLCRRILRIGQGTVVAVVVSLVSLESLVGRHEIEACALLACSTSFGIFILSDRFAAEGDGNRFSSSAVEFRFLGLVPLECGNGMGII